MRENRVVVIGAGMGGLVAALSLATAGLEVIVVERAPRPGGKIRVVNIGEARLDAGPTVLTMRPVLEEIFAQADANLTDFVTLKPAEILARHAWSDTERLDLFADLNRSVDAIGDFAGAAEAQRFREFCRRANEAYCTLEPTFIRKPNPTPLSLVRDAGYRDIARLKPYSRLWQELGKYFTDPRLRQLFGRYATYVGSSPFLAPPTLMLVAHVELDGVWMVEGGLHRIPEAVAELAGRRGAAIRYNTPAIEIDIKQRKVAGVKLADGEFIEASTVISNGDVSALTRGHFGREAMKAVPTPAMSSRSLSAVTWNAYTRTDGFPLEHHNVFFSRDYPREFDSLFNEGRIPDEPTIYVCAQDRGDPNTVIAGAERLLLLINAPPHGDTRALTSKEIEECEAHTSQLLTRCGLQLEQPLEAMVRTMPENFERLFPGTGGALYGRVSHGSQGPFRRPRARSRIKGLYLAGGSVHPGAGVPMTAISGQMAAQAVLKDLASSGSFHPAGMPGGTSMP